MTYDVEHIEGYPAVLLRMHADFNVRSDASPAVQACIDLFDAADEPLYWVNDMLDVDFGFSDVVSGLATFTRGNLAIINHPNFRGMLVVAQSGMIKMATNALQQAQYGSIEAHIFESMDGVLAFLEEQS